jgi:hypothetical protein
MREPKTPQQLKATTGQGQLKRAKAPGSAPGGAPIVTSIASQQQLHSTKDTISHIAPPNASDVRKIKNALPKTGPRYASQSNMQKKITIE